MADRRFFDRKGPFTVGALAALAVAEVAEGAEQDRLISDVAPIDRAGADEIAFLANSKYNAALAGSGAGACILRPADASRAPAGMALLLANDPYLAYARIAQAFYPDPAVAPAIADSAVVDPSVSMGDGCRIDPYAVIGPGAVLGKRCHVSAHVMIGRGVEIGDDARIGAGCTLSHCILGDRVKIFSGVRIGEEGFGFATEAGVHVSIPQIGRVLIEDDVQIGANSTIDRGAGPDTIIGAGSRIDNLVQIGHNVTLGRGCIVVAQAGVSGSTILEDHVVLAAQSGLAGHLKMGKGAVIGAKAGVMRDVPAGTTVMGSPAFPVKQFFKMVATLKRLSEKNSD